MQLLCLSHLFRVRPMAVLSRNLENRGQTLEVRVAEKHPEVVSH